MNSGNCDVVIVGNYKKILHWGGFQWHNIHITFNENQLTSSKVKLGACAHTKQ
jgi:hypothetical protein